MVKFKIGYFYLGMLICCFALTACDDFLPKSGEPIVRNDKVNFLIDNRTWTYDFKLVTQDYKNPLDHDKFNYPYYHVHLINDKGETLSVKNLIYIVQKNGLYQKVDNIPMMVDLNDIKLLIYHNDIYAIIANDYNFPIYKKTDCKLSKPAVLDTYLVGKFDKEKQIFLVDSTLQKPVFEDFKLVDSNVVSYNAEMQTAPFNCN